jgi:uncharacterized protein YuzE
MNTRFHAIYSEDVDAWYFYTDTTSKSARQKLLENRTVILDYDEQGYVIGVEVL